ncbi:MAG: 4-hydroxythreonine-4-phosphate dehydrogenase PdxA [Synergistaceae bacterium]|jgi:4-hydroxythreonine-4-phosphate dehydrogenase|nr:4-hydroxythreonine-4-phosphate dehydrogenase PdxA [Synergistaceae bacterium]
MKPVIGITMGDPAGVGSEITAKALSHEDIYEKCLPVVIGDYEALRQANEFSGTGLELREVKEPGEAQGKCGTLEYIDLGFLKPGSFEYKKVQKICGEASFQYVVKAIDLAMKKQLHAVVTGPINKEAIHLAGHRYSGHTEIFGDYTHTKDFAMLLTGGALKVIHVTTHCSMREACDRIKKERVLAVIRLAHQGLSLMGYENPKIGVAGLNPHAGENGLFGWEEEREIAPAVEDAKGLGLDVEGPVPPDTVFVKCQGGQYDVVVAMYHDQGHIPLKLAGFKLDAATHRYSSMSGVNSTIGLPIIRTSVDHGTAFGKAGEGRANEESMVDAIDTAIVMAKNKFGLS